MACRARAFQPALPSREAQDFAAPTDLRPMFRRSSEPLALSEASLLALRPALNAPVLNTDFLPVGPARAAIVVFAEEYGGIGLAIGVQSNESGQIAVFRNQEPIDAETTIGDALEPALSNAEQMGFLFDEDMVEGAPGGQGRSDAMALWGRLMGELDTPGALLGTDALSESMTDRLADSSAHLASPAAAMPELLLDEVAASEMPEIHPEISLELEHEAMIEVKPEPAIEVEASIESAAPGVAVLPASAPAQPLTKFRASASPEAPEATMSTASGDHVNPDLGRRSSDGRSELGRIPLVRVSREGRKRVPFIARLLSSF
jgi:hypothetical protein